MNFAYNYPTGSPEPVAKSGLEHTKFHKGFVRAKPQDLAPKIRAAGCGTAPAGSSHSSVFALSDNNCYKIAPSPIKKSRIVQPRTSLYHEADKPIAARPRPDYNDCAGLPMEHEIAHRKKEGQARFF